MSAPTYDSPRQRFLFARSVASTRFVSHLGRIIHFAPVGADNSQLGSPKLSELYAATALILVKTYLDDWVRAESLAILAPILPAKQLRDAFALAVGIGELRPRARAAAFIAANLAPAQRSEALAVVKAIEDPFVRLEGLGLILPYLPRTQRPDIVIEALLTAEKAGKEWPCGKVLAAVAPYLNPAQSDQALNLARSLDAPFRVHALAALSALLPSRQLSDIIIQANSLHDDELRSDAIRWLAPHISSAQTWSVLSSVMTIADVNQRLAAIEAICPRLTPTRVTEALKTAWAAQTDDRWFNIGIFARQLPANRRAKVLRALLEIAKATTDARTTWWALGTVASIVEDRPKSTKIIVEALAITHNIADESYRADTIELLAPLLGSAGDFTPAITAAETITDPEFKWQALLAIAPHMSSRVLANLLEQVKAIRDADLRGSVIGWLAPYLSIEQLAAAIKLVDGLPYGSRLRPLRLLMPYLPPALLDQLIVMANAATDDLKSLTIGLAAPFLSSKEVKHALLIVNTIVDKEARNRLLARLMPDLTDAMPGTKGLMATHATIVPPQYHPHNPIAPFSERPVKAARVRAWSLLEPYLWRALHRSRRFESKIDVAQRKGQHQTGKVAKVGGVALDSSVQTIPVINLPKRPPKLWPKRRPGRPKASLPAHGDLISFIRDVYGPYFPKLRAHLRAFIWAKDRSLYDAIQNYERNGRQLPPDIAMPSEQDISEARFQKAIRAGTLQKLHGPERATVRKKVWRAAKKASLA